MERYHVSWMTPKQAEKWTRRTHNVPDHVGLGWTPYTIYVTRGAISYRAFHKPAEFRAWLRANHLRANLRGRFLGEGIGNRSGYCVPA